MNKQDLEIIKTRTLFLAEGDVSSEIVLTDAVGGDMYFKFRLKYVSDSNGSANTDFNVIDPYHAEVTIETTATAVTKLSEPQEIGHYANSKILYFDFLVEPVISADEGHKVTITFYTN